MSNIKVLHILASLNFGGIETWLKDVVEYDKNDSFQNDFYLSNFEKGAFDDIVIDKGSNLYYNKLRGVLDFFSFYIFLKKNNYDVIHCHPHFFSGILCFIGYLAGIKIRISHSHNDTSNEDFNSSFLRKIYLKIQRLLILKFSNKKIACSEDAAICLFNTLNNVEILYCGLNLEKNLISNRKIETRNYFFKKYNIPKNNKIIGHVGRFVEQKNHDFLISIFKELLQKNKNHTLVLIGNGSLKEEIKLKYSSLINDIIYIEPSIDISDYYNSIFDLFLFPSLFEGLGLVLIEAQSASLPCIISDVIPHEAILDKNLVTTLNLNDSRDKWIDLILINLNREGDYTIDKELILNSKFNINNSIKGLIKVYYNA